MNPDESTIIVMNHRTRVDWNYVWIALYHATQKPIRNIECICKEKSQINLMETKEDIFDVMARGISKIKFVLKDEIKAIPGMGKLCNIYIYLLSNIIIMLHFKICSYDSIRTGIYLCNYRSVTSIYVNG